MRKLSVMTLVATSWLGCASSPPPSPAAASRKIPEAMRMPEKPKHRAVGRTDVQSYLPTTFDEPAEGPTLVEVQLTETFSGDIQGEGTGRVIQAMRRDRSATFAGIERVRGSIAGRSGTFLLQV